MLNTIKKIILSGYLALVFYLTLAPSSRFSSVDKIGLRYLLNFNHADKLVHFCMFFGLAFLVQLVYNLRYSLTIVTVFGISFIIEILQGIMPFDRSFDVLDLCANLAGILSSILLYRFFRRIKKRRV